MDAERNILDLEDQGFMDRMIARAGRNPFLTVGILGFITTLGIGAYRFKNQPKGAPISLYLIQLRVAAQSAVIGTLTVGMAYNMFNDYVLKKDHPPKPLKN